MTQNIPIDYNVFKSIITHSMIESDFLEELYKLRLDDIPNKIYSYHDVLTLLSLIFRDDYEILFTWIYDNNYGRETHTNIIYQNKSVQSISDIYQVLLKMYNKEINANDIIISPKVGDDLSQTDECFQKRIIESDEFLELKKSSQCLYFHLCMYADDDGFVNNARTIMRGIGATQSDLDELKQFNYVHEFDSGVILIMHWKVHNYIQKDRYRPTSCVDEKNMVELVYNSAYVLK